MNEIARCTVESTIYWFASNAEMNQKVTGFVTTFKQCETEAVTHLCIPSATTTLSTESELSIGGTSTRDLQDFWFFCTTSLCHGNNHLLNIFAISRRENRFTIILPKNGQIQIKTFNKNQFSEIIGPTKKHQFTTSKKDEIFCIGTYSFSKQNIQATKQYPLLVPCTIEVHESYKVQQEQINRLKLQCTEQANKTLYKHKNEGDFIIESISHTKYPVHTIVAAAHSAFLREAIKRNNKSYCIDLNDEDVEILIEYLYTGCIENLSFEIAPNLLMMAHKMGLPGMLELGKIALSAEINFDNAVALAVLAKKYELKDLLLKVFDFIQQNQKLLYSKSIETLDDVDLMRCLLQHLGKSSQ